MSYFEYTQRDIDEAVAELAAERDGLADENTGLGKKLDATYTVIGSALSDLRAIDDVPLSQLSAYINAVIESLGAVLRP